MASNEDANIGWAWFCARTQAKHEHIAASHLKKNGFKAFCPRLKLKRKTRQGAKWFTEALFPNYLFVKFDWEQSLRQVHHTHGISGVVHFGQRWPTIPDGEIELLQASLGKDGIHVLDSELKCGNEVDIVAGPLVGLSAIVTQVMPAAQRVQVLMEFLGRQATLKVSADTLLNKNRPQWTPK